MRGAGFTPAPECATVVAQGGSAAQRVRFAPVRPTRLVLTRLAAPVLLALLVTALLGLPANAAHADNANAPVAADPFEGAAEVALADGLYQVDIALEGGSGRATVASPASLEVRGGRGAVTLAWSSKNYDYVVLAGKKYLPANKAGNSTFVVPVTAYDQPIPLIGDTTAMSEAHEVDYTLTVTLASARAADGAAEPSASSSTAASAASSGAVASPASVESSDAPASSVSPAESSASSESAQVVSDSSSSGITWPWIVFILCAITSAACIGITIGILRSYRG